MQFLSSRFLRRVSIKHFLIGLVGLLAVVLTALSVNTTLGSYWRSKEVARVDIANEMADYVIRASGFEGVERGVTSAVLASGKAVDSATRRKIGELRTRGDEAVRNALKDARLLTEMDPTNTNLREAITKVEDSYASLKSGRTRVDANISTSKRDYTAGEFIRLMTSFIDANAEMRIAALTSTAAKDTLQEALRLNLDLKQAVWLVSEYAGRERATLANYVAARKPLDREAREKLKTFRAIVDLNLKPILRLKDLSGTEPEVLESISRMEGVFLGTFENLRTEVYAAADTGEYPVSGKEWISSATGGIDTILAVSAAVGLMVDDKVMADLAASKRSVWLSAAFLAVILALSAFSLWIINTKVISPIHYLSDTMDEVEKTGDLTAKIEVESEDENGLMADAFNRMIGKFHAIIQELHVSVERLASSSEELSTSSVQIAEGSKSQSTKAGQVSTAAQEMSATIAEVVKNVASAAEAAKEASTVAQNGGTIVRRTIGSMNGIASTARESSEIISSLGGRSNEIGNIVNVIDDIADQTNLLALNAAIEAARAGEQGRGFAVVADEVRKLAEKTMVATKEIGDMIRAMQDETGRAISSMENEVRAVEEGAALAEEAGKALGEIVSKVEVVTTMVEQVTTASQQQSAATDQISCDIEDVANVVTETSSSAEQIASASQEIAQLASGLKNTVEIFRVSGTPAANLVELRRSGPGKTAARVQSGDIAV